MIQPGQRSPDGRWVWNGTAWVPAPPPSRGGRAGVVIGLVAGCIGILVLTSIVVIVILLTMGNQISNVFSNVVAALGS